MMTTPIHLWPVIVVESRYGGVYEGSSWQAWPSGTFPGYDSGHDAFGEDIECHDFWASELAQPIGRGGTPNDAVEDMLRRAG